MRLAQRQVQESERIQQRLRQGCESRNQCLARDFRGARAFRVATHAVERPDQRGSGLDDDGNTVLVLFAGADQADLGMFDLQNRLPPFG